MAMEINKPVASIIVLAVSLVLLFLFILPQYQSSQNVDAALLQAKAQAQGINVYAKNIAALAEGLAARKEVTNTIATAAAADGSIAPLTYFFQKTAQDNGLVVTSIGFSQPVADTLSDSTANVLLAIHVSGSYQGLKSFIETVEHSSRLFNIATLSLSPSALIQKTQQYDLSLEIKIHT